MGSFGSGSIIASAALTIMLTAAAGCGQEQEQVVDIVQPEPLTIQLHADIIDPQGDTVSVESDSLVLVYYWLPLPGHKPMEEDLIDLAEMRAGGKVRVIPIQLDPDARNLAQTIVNDLGLSLPVYLADWKMEKTLGVDVLPVSMLLVPGGEYSVRGFGGPQRAFREAGLVPP